MANGKRIVIVGGVAGGASAAARARRISEEAEIILFERGAEISYANCGMAYYIGGVIRERERLLVQTPEGMRRRYRIEVRTKTEVTRIDRERRQVAAKNLDTGLEETVSYDELILSPGAEAVRPPIPGADGRRVHTLRFVSDMDAIKKAVDAEKPAHAVVIGGGYIGLEMTEALRQRGIGVTLVEMEPQVFPAVDPEFAFRLHQQLALHGVDLRLNTSAAAIREEGEQVRVQLSTGEVAECGLVIVSVGVRPEVRLAQEAGLEIGQRGGIVVDDHMRTNDPHIYAVGDAVEVINLVGGRPWVVPLAGPANRQGRIAADNALGRERTYAKTQGTAICKVFDVVIAMTGMSEKGLEKAGMPYEKIYVHPASHATYYPGAHPISLKLLFSPEDGRILGAQAVGTEGVDKRIDVIAVALRAGMTVFDLEDLELSYAPQFGSAKDAVNYAGFVAANVLRGDVALCHYEDVIAPRPDQLLLDVRTREEFRAGTIPGSRNIPIDELRDRLAELPQDRELLVFCHTGVRSYLACRILGQKGFRCRNLSGGYRTYSDSAGILAPEAQAEEEVREDTGEQALAPSVVVEQPVVVKEVDATGVQCPGPIMRLAEELRTMETGQAISILASDPGFLTDAPAWCRSTGHRLLAVTAEGGRYRAIIAKGERATPVSEAAPLSKKKTLIVFSNDFDRVTSAFIIANGAASMDSEVTMFFTFWGLNVLRKYAPAPVEKSLVERMFGWMMPRGPERLSLSKLNMGGLGLRMLKGIMQQKHVAPLPELIASARKAGVRIVACTMTMDIMGIKKEELIDGIEFGGVASYLREAESGNVNLFI